MYIEYDFNYILKVIVWISLAIACVLVYNWYTTGKFLIDKVEPKVENKIIKEKPIPKEKVEEIQESDDEEEKVVFVEEQKKVEQPLENIDL